VVGRSRKHILNWVDTPDDVYYVASQAVKFVSFIYYLCSLLCPVRSENPMDIVLVKTNLCLVSVTWKNVGMVYILICILPNCVCYYHYVSTYNGISMHNYMYSSGF
jgi:hypothetical protein